MIKFISSETLAEELKNELRSYFDSNLVDDSIFWPVFKECLSKFSNKYNPEKRDVIKITNKIADLPKNFERLCLAMACTAGTVILDDQRSYGTEEVEVCELDLCQSSCDVCTDECGNMYRVVQKNHKVELNWTSFDVLSLGRTNPDYCIEGCLNFRSVSPNKIEIKNGKIYTSFDKGYIYLEYLATLEEGEEILFPDNETVNKWIKAKLREAVFSYLYFNGIGDNLTRYREAQRQAFIQEGKAIPIIKRSGLSSFYNLANILIRRYNRLARTIWNEEQYPGHYGI